MKKTMINDDVLANVAGGKVSTKVKEITFEDRKKEFEDAWKKLKMDTTGISGMKMAELFDEWEMSGFKVDALSFLSEE